MAHLPFILFSQRLLAHLGIEDTIRTFVGLTNGEKNGADRAKDIVAMKFQHVGELGGPLC